MNINLASHFIKLIFVSILFWTVSHVSALSAQILSAEDAAKLSAEGKIHLIDVRTPEEWKETGVAASAERISMHKAGFLEKLNALIAGKKSAPIALICARGNRSAWLAGELEKRGYTNIIDVGEGMLGSVAGPGWLKRRLPIKR